MTSPSRDATYREHRALGALALVAALALVWLVVPLGTGVFLGALVAFTLHPLYRVIRVRTGRSHLAAFICAALSFLGVAAGVGGLLYVLIGRGVAVGRELPRALSPGGAVGQAASEISGWTSKLGVPPGALDQRLHHAAEQASSFAAGLAGKATSLMFAFALALFFMVVTAYCVLAQWARLAHWVEALSPLRPAHTRQLVDYVRVLGREIMAGTVVVGLVQGILAGAGYAVLGVPQAAFFGAMTAVASTIPAVGTMLVWAPLGAYLIATGHVGKGIAELLWGFLVVVALSDGFIRPKLVGRKSGLGLLPALIGLFGGIELFGFVGLLLGPTLVGVSLAIIRLYVQGRAQGARRRRGAPDADGYSMMAWDARWGDDARGTSSGRDERVHGAPRV